MQACLLPSAFEGKKKKNVSQSLCGWLYFIMLRDLDSLMTSVSLLNMSLSLF